MIDELVPQAKEKMARDKDEEMTDDPRRRKCADNYVRIRKAYLKLQSQLLRKIIPLVDLEPIGVDDYLTAGDAYLEMRRRLNETKCALSTLSHLEKDALARYQSLMEEEGSIKQIAVVGSLGPEYWDALLHLPEGHEARMIQTRLNRLRLTKSVLMERRRCIRDRSTLLKNRVRGLKTKMERRSGLMRELLHVIP
jgi:hypothetical protein